MRVKKKLVFKKETIAHLGKVEQEKIRAGYTPSGVSVCFCQSEDTYCLTDCLMICTP